ncbi:MAG: potassium uptake protein [Deltaproteobacteria bacterium]|nr:potassium uptake protein [Deltaproteobacteria bacterium]
MKESIFKRGVFSRFLSPERIFVLSFAALIFAGAFLLWSSFSPAKKPLSFVDALFTSASAVCVTGLTVIDIGKDLSFAGQIVTIFLFQIGGLGIITFSTLFLVLIGRGISIKFLGMILLWVRFSQDFSAGEAIYQAAYHAISAFNNCGYSLFSDSLTRYQGDLLVNCTVMALIVVGGIGFVVPYELWAKLRGMKRRISVHTRIVLLVTALLIFSGAILFYSFERDHILKDLPIKNQVLASLFQSIVPRTAGFNTVDIALLTNEALFMIIALMFIGASPGSTGGGVKTTSASILFLLMWSRFRGREEINVFRRTIPRELVQRTISITLASLLIISLIFSILLISGTVGLAPLESRHLFLEYLFETVSAFGTVGLSMNLTPKLNDFQKLAIIFMMFAGRVGPLTLALSLSRTTKRSLTFAEEEIMVG